MDLILAVVVYPLLLLVVTLGTGLLIEWAGGWVMHPALLPATGAAALIGLTQLTTTFGTTAKATPWLVLVAALAGVVLGRARLLSIWADRGEVAWPLLALLAAFVAGVAPVAFSGNVTLASYLLDTTSATHLLGAQKVTDLGRHFNMDAPTAGNAYLRAYFGYGYPAGAHTLLGATGKLIPLDLIWLYQPFLAFMEALAAPVLWLLARRIFGFGGFIAAVVGTLAALPALVYAYQLMGSIKEVAALPMIVLIWALVLDWRSWFLPSARGVIPLGLACAAGVGAVGFAFGAWIAAALGVVVLLILLARPRLSLAALAARVGLLGFVALMAALQTVRDLSHTTGVAKSLSQSNSVAASDPGNLLRPLRAIQVLGVWIVGDHRIDPGQHATATYLICGIALIGIVAGVSYLVRDGRWAPLLVFAATGVIWWALTKRGTIWTDAKMIMLTSPIAVLLAFGGLGTLAPGRRWLETGFLIGALGLGIAWSDGTLYHERNLAPTKRFEELASLNDRFAGQGPALLTDFDEYAMPLAPKLDPDQPGYAFHGAITVNGQVTGIGTGAYGSTSDLDQLEWPKVQQFPLIVQRRSPEQSRPPSNYKLAWQGTWFDVWRRDAPVDRVLQHVGAYSDGSATGVIGCSAIRDAAKTAASQNAQLAYATHGPVVQVNPQKAERSPNWQNVLPPIGIGLNGPGHLSAKVQIPQDGRWLLWLRGDVFRPLTVYVDGRRVGSLGHETGGDRNYVQPLPLQLTAGRHTLRLVRGGGSLAPGDGTPSNVRRIAFELPQSPGREVVKLQPSRWHELCGRQLDWLEVVRS